MNGNDLMSFPGNSQGEFMLIKFDSPHPDQSKLNGICEEFAQQVQQQLYYQYSLLKTTHFFITCLARS